MRHESKRILNYLRLEHSYAVAAGDIQRARIMKLSWWVVFAAAHGMKPDDWMAA